MHILYVHVRTLHVCTQVVMYVRYVRYKCNLAWCRKQVQLVTYLVSTNLAMTIAPIANGGPARISQACDKSLLLPVFLYHFHPWPTWLTNHGSPGDEKSAFWKTSRFAAHQGPIIQPWFASLNHHYVHHSPPGHGFVHHYVHQLSPLSPFPDFNHF